jgi:hypothetical protein
MFGPGSEADIEVAGLCDTDVQEPRHLLERPHCICIRLITDCTHCIAFVNLFFRKTFVNLTEI